MGIHAVNANDVEVEQSAHGHTKYLRRSDKRDAPTIMIRHWGRDTNISAHKHPYGEMFYVLDGEIEMGGVVYPAGSCIYIEKDTEYGPTRAPKGGTVLRFAEGRST